ncbi:MULTISPECIES: serine/threonine-protein kinase [Okeania]|uniref:Protein kinase domain-containing protein n=1 Tax=Okeania hirsuta TaxID=1458930 RepID=A0A3N6PAC6_9CYAN|nr:MULTISPECIES: serine/threonine-protein kinase [Okeania]NET14523.1 protein kinase [Okeania sp. SIO1H6]NES78578.1 protein kinase [Okeania sp. SIO1H4]NES89772.1 protein kinase [Okeania sp. SIO2B9]NET21987.1 protein kinase [Okeania sp. SIO1H5]NET78804.1 protein kinase [Okeania sp. SIO1F9]
MSYCYNPTCQKPQNPDKNIFCQSCGAKLILREHYRLLKPIGIGTFSRTFLAVDQDIPSKPICVIKQFLPVGIPGKNAAQNISEIEKASASFSREALQLDKLGKHPQIPSLLAYFVVSSYRYLVQEYIEGKNLAQELKEQGTFNEQKIRKFLREILPVLQFIHKNQVIHRDIKPENIIRRGTNENEYDWGRNLYLVGFGAAKAISTNPAVKSGTVIGSPEYTAPEQLIGQAVFASDIYSLGVVCIQLMTLLDPFDLRHGEEWLWQEHLPRPVSTSLNNIIDRMLEPALQQRYHSVEEVLNDLMQTTKSSWEGYESLESYGDQVRTVAFSIDGQTVVSGGEDNSIKVWTLKTGSEPRTLGGWMFSHSGWVQEVAFSSDGQTLVSGSNDGTVKVWNLGTGKLVRTLGGWLGQDWGAVQAIAISQDGQILASGHGDKTVKVWYLNSGKMRGYLKGHTAWVESVAISPDGKVLASGSGDKTIKLWDVGTGRLLLTLTGHSDVVRSVAIAPDGQILASGSSDNTIRLWQLATGDLLGILQHPDGVNAVAISPDGLILASGCRDGNMYLWNPYTMEELGVLSQEAVVNAVTFSVDGQMLAAGCGDGSVGIWRRLS